MRIQKSRLFFTAFLILGFIACHARAATVELDLEKAVALALKNNPNLKAKKEKLRIDHERLNQAKRRFQFNPELSVDATYRERKFPSPSGETGTDFELSILQEIEISSQRTHRMDAAEKFLNAAKWRIKDSERRLGLDVRNLFYDLLALQEKMKIQKQRLALHEDLFDAGQKRFQQEDISVLEIDTLRFDLDQAQHDLSKLKTEKLKIEKVMRSSLGLDEGVEIIVVGPLSTLSSQERKIPNNLEELEDCALSHRPDFKAIQAALEGNDAVLQLAKSNKIPNLSLGPLFKSDNEDQVIGASLMIPLPFFNRNQEAVTEARVNLDLKQIALNAKKVEIQQELAATYRRLQLAKERFDFYGEDYLAQLKKRMAFPKKAYQTGEISIFEFSVAQGRLAKAQMRYLYALLALLKARADLYAQLSTCMSGNFEPRK